VTGNFNITRAILKIKWPSRWKSRFHLAGILTEEAGRSYEKFFFLKEGRTPIRPRMGSQWKRASRWIIGPSCAAADRNAEQAVASLYQPQSASRMAIANPPLRGGNREGTRRKIYCYDLFPDPENPDLTFRLQSKANTLH
jgi:hypothetical protein